MRSYEPNMKASILAIFAVTSAGLGLYFWLETKNLKRLVDKIEEALEEENVRKSELRKKVDGLNFRADQVQSHYTQAEIANRKLSEAMKQLSRKEQGYARRVDELNQELDRIRARIHETYSEANAYKKKIRQVHAH